MESEVAGMRVAVEHPGPVHRALGEPEQDLGGTAPQFGVAGLDEVGEPGAVRPLGGEDPPGRQLRHHRRDPDEGVARVAHGELVLAGGLDAVVELFEQSTPELVDDGAGVEAVERERRRHAVQQLGVAEVAADGDVDAGVLHLHGHFPPVAGDGPVDLADRGGGDGLVAPVEEHLLGRRTEFGLDDLRCERRRHGGHVGLQRGQGVAGFVGEALDDEGQDLPGLHHGALHVAELACDVLGAADGVGPVELGAPVGVGAEPPDAVDAVADATTRRQPPDAKGPLEMDAPGLVRQQAAPGDDTGGGGQRGRSRRSRPGDRATSGGHRESSVARRSMRRAVDGATMQRVDPLAHRPGERGSTEVERDLEGELVGGAGCECRALGDAGVGPGCTTRVADLAPIGGEAGQHDLDVGEILLESIQVGHCAHGGRAYFCTATCGRLRVGQRVSSAGRGLARRRSPAGGEPRGRS
jgi:hypothetical protein